MKVKVFTGFQFVPKQKKKPRVAHGKRYTKIVYCVCGKNDNGYYALVNLDNNRKLNFTKASFNLKDRLVVFSHKLDKHNRPICIHRSPEVARMHPGISTQYTPFCENYVYSGYIVKHSGEFQFDMHEIVGPYSLHNNLIREKIKLYDY